jgi:hypothetical protein
MPFSGTFAQLRKVTTSFIMSVCPSVRMEQLGSHQKDFHEIRYLTIFKQICKENSSLMKNGPISCSVLFRMRNVSYNSCRENKNTFYVEYFFFKLCILWNQCGKIMYSQAGHRWQYGECTLHAGYLSLQTHNQNTQYLLISHCNNGCTNMLQHYDLHTLPILYYTKILCRKIGLRNVALVEYNLNVKLWTAATEVWY